MPFRVNPSGRVEKAILSRSFYVGTGLVLQDESFRMNPCPNSKEDSHPANGGIPTITSSF